MKRHIVSMMRDGTPTKTTREKMAEAELRKLAEESQALMLTKEPRDMKRMAEIADRGRVLLPMVGWEDPR